MKQEVKNFLNKLEELDKEIKINSSGSTKDNKREKIRAGQSYLYQKNGMESEVFEIRFKEKVDAGFLNQAYITTMKRYPYFNTKLIEKDGDFYIVQNLNLNTPKRTKKLYKLGGNIIGKNLIDVTYYNCSLFISFHHALCDARGVKPFIESLIYYYCMGKYNNEDIIKGIRLEDSPLLKNETVEPFLKEYEYNKEKEKEKDFPNISRDGFHLEENKKTDNDTDYRYEIEISHDEFMKFCKNINGTPVILLTLLMSKGITKLYPKYDKPIIANIATDIRKALGVENTFKNCVKSMVLPYTQELSELNWREQAIELRDILDKQRNVDYCRSEANKMIGLFNKLDEQPTFEAKQKMMGFFNGMTLNTYIISYVGQFILGSNENYIDSIHLYNSGTTGLGINMISTNEKFIIDIKQNFSSDKYAKALVNELKEIGIESKLSECIDFSTPTDDLIKRKQDYNITNGNNKK